MWQKNDQGKKCTVLWHVDDLKISHKGKSVVDKRIGRLNQIFGLSAPLTMAKEVTSAYLGMKLNVT